jgi:hypothetical protein
MTSDRWSAPDSGPLPSLRKKANPFRATDILQNRAARVWKTVSIPSRTARYPKAASANCGRTRSYFFMMSAVDFASKLVIGSSSGKPL